ncbi:MAG: hypothetical protein JSV24_09935 [Bacteroidales bacterium]|nr:MAG: hypothetical protein JSV24_09935 [Bacteroidales bacterium]
MIQIELINPQILVLLGSTALKGLVDNKLKISQMRGTWLHLKNRWVMPVYHTSALLKKPSLKRETRLDFHNIARKYRELVNPNHFSEDIKGIGW